MILVVHVKPNASISRVTSWIDRGTVSIALAAPPIDGKANTELIKYLSLTLLIPKIFINLKRGHNSRVKHIELPPGADLNLLR